MRICLTIGCLLLLSVLVIARPDVSHLNKTKKDSNHTTKTKLVNYKLDGTKMMHPSLLETIKGNENDNLEKWDVRYKVAGVPGVDYPIYWESPETSFTCEDRYDGYYADVAARCQVFHVCAKELNAKTADGYVFLCPNGTIFSQEKFVCDWYPNVDCNQSELLYFLNEKFDNVMNNEYEMLTSVQRMFSFTLRSLISGRFGGRLRNLRTTTRTAAEIDETTSATSSSHNINENVEYSEYTTTTIEPEGSGDNFSSPTTENTLTTTEDSSELLSSTEDISTSTADSSIDTATEEENIEESDENLSSTTTNVPSIQNRQPKEMNSYSDIWGADLEELDNILNNRLKKSYESVTPGGAISFVTRRDVSHLSGGQNIQFSRYTYLPPINLRPPLFPATTPSLNYYQNSYNNELRNTFAILRSQEGIIQHSTEQKSVPQRINLLQNTNSIKTVPLSTSQQLRYTTNPITTTTLTENPGNQFSQFTQFTRAPVQTIVTQQQSIQIPVAQSIQQTVNQPVPTLDSVLRAAMHGGPTFNTNPNSNLNSNFNSNYNPNSNFNSNSKYNSNSNIISTKPNNGVEVNIVPSYNWYLNDARDRGSYLQAVQDGIVTPPDQLHFTQAPSYNRPQKLLEPPHFQGYPLHQEIIPQLPGLYRTPPQNFQPHNQQFSNRRLDDSENASFEDGDAGVFRGLSSYNAPISSVGKLLCDSDSVTGNSIPPSLRKGCPV